MPPWIPSEKNRHIQLYSLNINISKKSEKSDICKQIEASVAANIQNSQNISPIQNRQESKKDFFEKSCYKRNN